MFGGCEHFVEQLLKSSLTVPETMQIAQKLSQKFSYPPKIWRNFFYLATKSLTHVEPRDNFKLPLREVFRIKFGLYVYLLSTLAARCM